MLSRTPALLFDTLSQGREARKEDGIRENSDGSLERASSLGSAATFSLGTVGSKSFRAGRRRTFSVVSACSPLLRSRCSRFRFDSQRICRLMLELRGEDFH